MNEREDRATRYLEEGWDISWTGWKLSMYWPVKHSFWFAVAPNRKDFIESRVVLGDKEEDRSVLGHAKEESRLRLRMNIDEYNKRKAHELDTLSYQEQP